MGWVRKLQWHEKKLFPMASECRKGHHPYAWYLCLIPIHETKRGKDEFLKDQLSFLQGFRSLHPSSCSCGVSELLALAADPGLKMKAASAGVTHTV